MKHIAAIPVLFLLAVSCGTSRHASGPDQSESVADRIWTYSKTHPDGFTLDIKTMTQPTEGICAAYEFTQSSHSRSDLEAIVTHATSHGGFVGGWLDTSDSLYYFDSVRIFPDDSLQAAINFGKANHQIAIFNLSTGKEIRLVEDVEYVSPTNLIILYDPETGKGFLMKAIEEYGAKLLYDYSLMPGIAIRIPDGADILEAIAFFDKVKGVTAVERDHIYHLTDPIKPKLETK